MKAVRRFLQREDGPTAVEYAIVLAGILGLAFAAITVFGLQAQGTFDNNASAITGS
jgi:pilus assembly protein Flp/PilA